MTSSRESDLDNSGAQRGERFFVNVIWTWISVGANFVAGFLLSPYIIRALGEARYGIWALTFALVESFALFDMGFRTAVVNFTSRMHARGDTDGINAIMNTSLAFFGIIGVGIVTFVALLGGQAHRFFGISQEYRSDFAILIRLISVSWALGMVFSVFQAGLEAFQCFKIYYRMSTSVLLVRSIGCLLVLAAGHGLVAMGIVVLAAQCAIYVLTAIAFKQVFGPLRLSTTLFKYSLWKEMAAYGAHSFLALWSLFILGQGPSLVVGHFTSDVFIGLYTLPSRLLRYAVEMVTSIGAVTAPSAAELITLGRSDQIVRLATYLNRYCFALFLPIAIFFSIYGKEFIKKWVGDSFAIHSAPLLFPFILSTAIAMAGQYNSSSILFGLSRHATYSKSLFVESLGLIAGLWLVVPRYGILGAAWVVALLMILNRGIITPYILCRSLDCRFFSFMGSIYLRPTLSSLPAIAVTVLAKSWCIMGRSWFELFAALGITTVIYYATALFFSVEADHRVVVRGWVIAGAWRLIRRMRPEGSGIS